MNRLLFFFLMAANVSAFAAVYKCEKDGQISYGDRPCEERPATANRNAGKFSSALEEGMSAFDNGNYVLAVTKLTPLAENGVPMAQNTLGRMYLKGNGVQMDFNKSIILFRKAAIQGLPNAQNNLGVMYAAGSGVTQDYKQATEWFRKAADQGYAIAMNNLAGMYENGLGVKPDYVEAAKWRNKAKGIESAKDNDLVEIKTVGSNEYEKGLEYYYRYAFKEAFELIRKAAEKGNPEAQMKLASMYQYGQGVQRSDSQSQYWANKAKNQGYTPDDGRDSITLIDVSPEEARRMSTPPPEPRASPGDLPPKNRLPRVP
ncbi:MAG: hypothetical protein WC216_11735 [Gallionella sp.]|jgi:TPR repeat protein